jgi:hypothetical protein
VVINNNEYLDEKREVWLMNIVECNTYIHLDKFVYLWKDMYIYLVIGIGLYKRPLGFNWD